MVQVFEEACRYMQLYRSIHEKKIHETWMSPLETRQLSCKPQIISMSLENPRPEMFTDDLISNCRTSCKAFCGKPSQWHFHWCRYTDAYMHGNICYSYLQYLSPHQLLTMSKMVKAATRPNELSLVQDIVKIALKNHCWNRFHTKPLHNLLMAAISRTWSWLPIAMWWASCEVLWMGNVPKSGQHDTLEWSGL